MEPRWRRGASAVSARVALMLLCAAIGAVDCTPVLLGGSLLNFQGASSPARNIRHVPCISRKTGEGGTCMFAIDCLKSNGSHLGTCIDRFYFGSCCRIPEPDLMPQIEDNTIFGNYDKPFVKPEDDNSLNAIPVKSAPSSTAKTPVRTTIKPITAAIATKPSSLSTKRPTSTNVSIISSISTKPQKIINTSPTPSIATLNQTEPPYKLSTFQSVSAQKPHITAPRPTVSTNSPQPQPQPSSNITRITMKPMLELTNGTNSKPTSPATIKPIITFKPTLKPVKVTAKPTPKPVATQKPTVTKKPLVVSSTTPVRKPPNPTVSLTTVSDTYTNPNKTKKPLVSSPTTPKPLPSSTVQASKPTVSTKPSTPPSSSSTPLLLTSTVKPETSATTVKTVVITVRVPSTISSTQKIRVTDKPTEVTETKPAISQTEPTTLKSTTPKPLGSTTIKATQTSASTTQKASTTTTKPKLTSPVSVKTTSSPKISSTTTRPKLPNDHIQTTTSSAKISTTTTEKSTITTPKSTTSNAVNNDVEDTGVSKPALTTAKPGFVTWTNSIQSTTAAPGTTHNATSEASWSPITTPEGWILLNSPTSPTPSQTPSIPTPGKPSQLSTSKPASSSTLKPLTSKPLLSSSTPSSLKPIPPHLTKPTVASSITTTIPSFTSTPSPSAIGVNATHASATAVTYSTPNSSGAIAATEKSTVSPIEAVTSPSFSTAGLNMSDFKDVCGRRLWPEARIVGGAKSSFGKWPWQISLRQWKTSTYLHKCGAALLNENWAITAAHCVDSVPPSDLLLRLGEYDLASEEEPYGFQERRVQIVASHPQFDPRTFEYDLALLRFHEPVVFQPNILPVCVPGNDDNYIGKTAYVTGWGRLYEDGPLPSILQEVSVPIINNSVCETMYRSAGFIEHIPNIFICAGWRKGGFDSCEGDSGGPMVLRRDKDDRFVLAGIISWGIGCAEPNQPGVYTRISEFRDWINQILQF